MIHNFWTETSKDYRVNIWGRKDLMERVNESEYDSHLMLFYRIDKNKSLKSQKYKLEKTLPLIYCLLAEVNNSYWISLRIRNFFLNSTH